MEYKEYLQRKMKEIDKANQYMDTHVEAIKFLADILDGIGGYDDVVLWAREYEYSDD